MKRTILTLAMIGAMSGLTALAQDATPSPAPGGPRHHEGRKEWGGGPRGPMREVMESLSPAEREQLKVARKKTKDDPAVEEARKKAAEAMKAVREAEKAAMLKADPTIGPVLDKLEAAIKAHRPERGPEQP